MCTWFVRLTVISDNLNNLWLYKNRLLKPLQYRGLKKTWVEVTWGLLTPSAGNGGCFLAGLSVGHGGWVA